MALLDGYRRRRFLSPEERGQVEAGLLSAARHTRARMTLVIDETAAPEPTARARQCFQEWMIDEAERPTAILLYASAASWTHALAAGDTIRREAPAAFWEAVASDLDRHFAERRFCDGLFKALSQIALQLKHHYPAAGSPDPPAA